MACCLPQQRPLEPVYPVVIFDALRVKIRDEGVVRNKAVYLALGVDREGQKDVLGLWVEQTEGAKFWLRVLGELRGRGVQDVLIALVDGLTGFPDAVHAVYPDAQVHQCVVHLVRQSLVHVGWQERKAAAAQLRRVYHAPGEAAALAALDALEASPLGRRLPAVAAVWRRHWAYVAPIFSVPLPVRRVLYTTNALESLHERTLAAAEGDEGPGALPDRRGRGQAPVPGAPQRGGQVAAPRGRVARRLPVLRRALRRTLHRRPPTGGRLTRPRTQKIRQALTVVASRP